MRRARVCTQSIVLTTTGVGKVLVDALLNLASCIKGIWIRVPTQDISLIDLTIQVARNASLDEVKLVFRKVINK